MVKTSPSNAEGTNLLSGWDAKIPHVSWPKNQNLKQYCNKFNTDFKDGPHQKNLLKKRKYYWILLPVLMNMALSSNKLPVIDKTISCN